MIGLHFRLRATHPGVFEMLCSVPNCRQFEAISQETFDLAATIANSPSDEVLMADCKELIDRLCEAGFYSRMIYSARGLLFEVATLHRPREEDTV